MLCSLLSFHALWAVVVLIVVKLYNTMTAGICRSQKQLNGKTAIVTGANTGIGKETALDLARRGAKVILACRDLKNGKIACDEIIARSNNSKVEVRHLDLSSLASVRKFAKDIISTETHLEILVNNAGAGGLGEKRTADGLQIGMQVNHFSPFLLTCLLVGLLKKSAPSRIVMVSSLVHKYAKFDLDNLNSEKWFNDIQVYNCSKLANILVANELSRKLSGTGVTVNSLHPGVVGTDIMRRMPRFIYYIAKFMISLIFKNPEQGAQTSIYLAVSEDVEGVSGKYFSDCKEATVAKDALDVGLAKKLWEKSEVLVGLKAEEMDL
ncbi:retinol dehydrogenase 11 isoform X2 [Cryptotermes secundus]|uniref:retinol dehydrogenase 11 isoform X2 n=1 Tax=Cryptotermes secundus TaxID=105785 RepID=UPI000CD7ADF6|nr:retinol dehydrogenase 11 isoform X2 [Cryptotermes secundus]